MLVFVFVVVSFLWFAFVALRLSQKLMVDRLFSAWRPTLQGFSHCGSVFVVKPMSGLSNSTEHGGILRPFLLILVFVVSSIVVLLRLSSPTESVRIAGSCPTAKARDPSMHRRPSHALTPEFLLAA